MIFLSKDKARLESEVAFWRGRADSLEKELRQEIARNRRREDQLVNKVIISKGYPAIREPGGFEESAVKSEALKKLDKALAEEIEFERQAFVANTVKSGVTKEEAEKYFDEHQKEILG